MKRLVAFLLVLGCLLGATNLAMAGGFYVHSHNDYWWYMEKDPAFSTVIPNKADAYVQKNLLGMKVLDIVWEKEDVTMEIASVEKSSVELIRKSLEERFKPLLQNVTVLGNRQLTTSNALAGYFYALEGTSVQGKKVMMRAILFQRGEAVVYQIMFLDSSKYQGDFMQYWLRAVNDFEWN